jgi:hypothetical protein
MKYIEFKKRIQAALFTKQDLRLMGGGIFDYQLSLWQKQGHIIKIKNGLYIFEDKAGDMTPEEIAPRLYSPSYISLEKALSIYGLIPETVYGVTSITPKTTRKFKNYFGDFYFKHIKPSLFWGYSEIKGGIFPYFIADPEKALLDFIYFNLSRMKTKKAIDSFRFNRRSIGKLIAKNRIKQYSAMFKNRKMKGVLEYLLC